MGWNKSKSTWTDDDEADVCADIHTHDSGTGDMVVRLWCSREKGHPGSHTDSNHYSSFTW